MFGGSCEYVFLQFMEVTGPKNIVEETLGCVFMVKY